MDVSRFGVDELRQSIDVGAQQLLQSSVVEDLADNLVLSLQSLKYLLVCNVLSCLSLLGLAVEFQVVEKHFAHLLGAGNVEAYAGHCVNLFFESQHLPSEKRTCLLQSLCVNHHASFLHFCKDWHQWHFDVCEEVPKTLLLEFLLKALFQPYYIFTVIYREQIVEIVPHFWMQKVVGNLCVEHWIVRQSLCLEFFPVGFEIVTDYGIVFHHEKLSFFLFLLWGIGNRTEQIKLHRTVFCWLFSSPRGGWEGAGTEQIELHRTVVVFDGFWRCFLWFFWLALLLIQQLSELQAFV